MHEPWQRPDVTALSPTAPHRRSTMCVVHITLGVPRRTDFSKIWPPGIYEIPNNWPPSRGRSPPYPTILYLLQVSNLPKLWNLVPINKGREIRMDTRNEMCRANNEEGTTGYAN